MRRFALALCPALLLVPSAPARSQAPEAPAPRVRKIDVGGEGGWDYLTADPEAKRLYVSRGNRVVVIDTDAEKVVGELAETPGVHGIAVVPELGRGFTSNGRDSTVTAFDTKTLKATGRVKVGGGPDAIMYDPASGRVFTFNHGSKDATAVDPSAVSVAGTVALGGVPEAAVSDGKGHVFVNLMDTNEVVEFDAKGLKVVNRFSLGAGRTPTGLAFDREHRRLFSACRASQTMVVLDADNGKVLASLPIGQGSDGCAFDPERGLAYSSNGDGTLTIVREVDPATFRVVATVPTQASARTIAIDPKAHRIYLSAATYAPAPQAKAGDEAKPKAKGARRQAVPGSFVILVVGD